MTIYQEQRRIVAEERLARFTPLLAKLGNDWTFDLISPYTVELTARNTTGLLLRFQPDKSGREKVSGLLDRKIPQAYDRFYFNGVSQPMTRTYGPDRLVDHVVNDIRKHILIPLVNYQEDFISQLTAYQETVDALQARAQRLVQYVPHATLLKQSRDQYQQEIYEYMHYPQDPKGYGWLFRAEITHKYISISLEDVTEAQFIAICGILFPAP